MTSWDAFEHKTGHKRPADWQDRPDGPDRLDLICYETQATGFALDRKTLLDAMTPEARAQWQPRATTPNAPTILQDIRVAAAMIRNLPAFPDPPPPDYTVPDQLRDAIDAAGYYRADLAMNPTTVQQLRDLGASRPLHPPDFGPLQGLPPALGPHVITDPDIPPGVTRLRPRTS